MAPFTDLFGDAGLPLKNLILLRDRNVQDVFTIDEIDAAVQKKIEAGFQLILVTSFPFQELTPFGVIQSTAKNDSRFWRLVPKAIIALVTHEGNEFVLKNRVNGVTGLRKSQFPPYIDIHRKSAASGLLVNEFKD